LKNEELVTTTDIVEEAAYVGLSVIYGCRAFKLRDMIKKGLNVESITFLEALVLFLKRMRIKVILPPTDPKIMIDIIIRYGLLPADATIAATCKERGIKKIAIFDSDFKRVDFLDVILA